MLYIVATPIGNIEDITLRALRVLGEVDFILAEDTRKTGSLLKRFGIKRPLVSFYDHNEPRRLPGVIRDLKREKSVALVSNAGTPTLSDPGYKLVRECRREGIPITSLPGPSSISNAVALSSLPHDKFIFLGYLPRKKNLRKRLFENIKTHVYTFVFFESPHRLRGSLTDIMENLGNKKITVAREMTKKFEEVLELSVEEALKHFEQRIPRGEFTLIVDNQQPE